MKKRQCRWRERIKIVAGVGRVMVRKVMLNILDVYPKENGKPVEDVKLDGDMIRCVGCAGREKVMCEVRGLFQSAPMGAVKNGDSGEPVRSER